ncbi:MAG: hypothetical protein ABI668_08685 [Sphingorhabdus sp.]
MSEVSASKISLGKKLGGFIVGLASVVAALAAVSAEVRAWFGDRIDDVKEVVGVEPSKEGSKSLGASDEVAVVPSTGVVSITPGEFRLKLDPYGNSAYIDTNVEASLKIGNNGKNPVEVVWIAPRSNARVDLQGSSALDRIKDISGIAYCGYADSAVCWQRSRALYTVIDPGARQIAIMAFREIQPSTEQPALAAVKKATIVGKLHVVDTVTGQGRVENVSVDGIDVVNQIPPLVN